MGTTVRGKHRGIWNELYEYCNLPFTPLFMGAESCEKSLETFTFDNNRAIWRKSLQTFCVANVAEESCTAEKIPVRGSAK